MCFAVNFGGGISFFCLKDGARNVHANELRPMLAVSFQVKNNKKYMKHNFFFFFVFFFKICGGE